MKGNEMKHESRVCPGCGESSTGEFCDYCGARLKFSDGKIVEAHVEGSNHAEVAKVAKTLNEQQGGSSKWSDRKKWVMGIISSVILGVLGWVGVQIATDLKQDQVSRIELISPKDGASFDHFPRSLNLEWGTLPGTSRYIVEVEIQSDGKWSPHPFQSRYVTTNTTLSLEFVGAQPGRWKVTSVGAEEDSIGESPWWYFSFSR